MKRTSPITWPCGALFTRVVTLATIVFSALYFANVGRAQAAELVVFESATCEWCDLFHEEIGPIYPKTPEAACAPLRRVDIHDSRPENLSFVEGIIYTPTFVLVEDGREVGRITGYPGEHFFWSTLKKKLGQLQAACRLD